MSNNNQSKSDNNLQIFFVILNFMSSFFELGSLILLLKRGESLNSLLIIGLSYQLGNLIASSIKFTRNSILLLIFFALLVTINLPWFPNLIYPSIGLASLIIQESRRYVTSANTKKNSTLLKRSIRIIGFIVAGFVTEVAIIMALLCTICIVSFLVIKDKEVWSKHLYINWPKSNSLSFIMVIHQTHYFSYAYLIPFVIVKFLNIPIKLVGLAFIVGWISYITSETILRRFNLYKIFIFGHFLVFISLLVMSLSIHIPTVFLGAWFFSGFGGGTVFCLTRLNEQSYNKVDMHFGEDIGHVLGVLFTLLIITAFSDISINYLFHISSLIALSTALAMKISSDSERFNA